MATNDHRSGVYLKSLLIIIAVLVFVLYSTMQITKQSVKYDDGLDFTSPMQVQNKTIYYHTYWNLEKYKSLHFRIMKLNILSYLATQNLNETKLIIWREAKFDDLVLEELRKEFTVFFETNTIEIRRLDFEDFCSNGLFKSYHKPCMHYGKNPSNFVAYSDFVRFLVLYKYSGIYVDGDVVFLKDMSPFWHSNFAYRWSSQSYVNTAVLGIDSNLNFTKIFYKTMLSSTSYWRNIIKVFHPQYIYSQLLILNDEQPHKVYKKNASFMIYSSDLFDPSWLCNDNVVEKAENQAICGFEEFYDLVVPAAKFDMKLFFPDAYTYHIHSKNCGSCVVKSTSYFSHLEEHFRSVVEKRKLIGFLSKPA
jgi:hypothetical protein